MKVSSKTLKTVAINRRRASGGKMKPTTKETKKAVKEAVDSFLSNFLYNYPSRKLNRKVLNEVIANSDKIQESIRNLSKDKWGFWDSYSIERTIRREVCHNDDNPNIYDEVFPRKEAYKKPIVTRIKVPSGVLIFANDFRYIPEIDEIEKNDKDYYSINDLKGDFRYRRLWGKNGIFCSFLGNSSPTIFQKDNEIQIIADYSEYDELSREWSKEEGYKEVGGICTDVWHFMAMDYGRYKKLTGEDFDEYWHTLVHVEAGTYEMQGLHHLCKDEKMRVYVKIKKV